MNNARRAVPYVVALLTVVTGCSATIEGRAEPAPGELPPEFPNLSAYTEVDPGTYDVIDVPRVQGFHFRTPDGLICGNNAYPEARYEHLSCWGNPPALGPGTWDITVDATAGVPASASQVDPEPDHTAMADPPPPVLEPFHKVTADKGVAVCGVDDQGMTACHLGGHGFVLTATSMTLF